MTLSPQLFEELQVVRVMENTSSALSPMWLTLQSGQFINWDTLHLFRRDPFAGWLSYMFLTHCILRAALHIDLSN